MNHLLRLLLFLLPIACTPPTPQTIQKTGPDVFTWNIQRAGYIKQQADQMGETTFKGFLHALDTFPWMDQIEQVNRLVAENSATVSPTLMVKDLKTDKDLFISMGGDRHSHGYFIGYVYFKEQKAPLPWQASTTVRWVEMYLTEERIVINALCRLFFNREEEQFEATLRSLEFYLETEAAN